MLRLCALMGVLGMTTFALADPPAATPASDLDKLQGYWKPLQCEYEGKAQMPTDRASALINRGPVEMPPIVCMRCVT